MTPLLWDTHIHLDFIQKAQKIACDADKLGLGMIGVTVAPNGYLRALEILRDSGNVHLGCGLHPWWVADGRCDKNDALKTAELVKDIRFVGEIGLDGSLKHVPAGSLPIQAEAFETICRSCAQTSNHDEPKILSVHAVKAANMALDILERTGCLTSCRCIFHWFTGSNEELTRAVKTGCMFSVNEMMLQTRRGREYVRQLPKECLLLETDFPPGEDVPFSADKIAASLKNVLAKISEIRHMDMEPVIRENSNRLLGI